MQRYINDHKLPVFIIGAITVAIVMVLISMKIYYASDAFRLDLSRPEHVPIREKIDRAPASSDGFAADGDITEAVLDDFLQRYKKESEKATKVPVFGNDVLSNKQLGLE
ncbi:MAG: hypothetical protein Q4A37_03060 [Candidatus Saccharibacteria bacterium]|nr:hypothetical protein [Candidatus Saccharibacteria bacterium]